MMRRTSRTVLGILDQAGPVLIRASEDADKASSQDMAVLGSVVTYAEGLGVQFGSVATEDFRIGFNRYSVDTVARPQPELSLWPASALQGIVKFADDANHKQQAAQCSPDQAISAGKCSQIDPYRQLLCLDLELKRSRLQVVHLAVQMLVGPNELAIIAAANTAHDNLRRALIGQSSFYPVLSCASAALDS